MRPQDVLLLLCTEPVRRTATAAEAAPPRRPRVKPACAPHGRPGRSSGARPLPPSHPSAAPGTQSRREGTCEGRGTQWHRRERACPSQKDGAFLAGRAPPRGPEKERSQRRFGGATSTGNINALQGRDPQIQLRACPLVCKMEVTMAVGTRSTCGGNGPFSPTPGTCGRPNEGRMP